MLNDIEMLNFIRQNVQMGVDGIKLVIDDTEDKEFKELLKAQMTEYGDIYSQADGLLEEKGGERIDASAASKIAAHLTGKMKTLSGSTSKIADAMIQGSTMGVTKIIKHINDFCGSGEVKRIAERLLKTEENNIEQLKKHL